jgi:predicted RNA-binding Zn-ribbon protein involved in translation (DUF1610 family)
MIEKWVDVTCPACGKKLGQRNLETVICLCTAWTCQFCGFVSMWDRLKES